jgi:uncharacterized protein (DUF1015 family)
MGEESLGEIKPFRGTFYNKDIVGNRSLVVAPPYDIINAEEKVLLAARSPYNIVQLILPQSDGDQEFWNTAAALFKDWKEEKVLVADDTRGFYAYRQEFLLFGERCRRLGLVVALRCSDFTQGEILPHEKTFPRTRDERLNLLRACRANFSEIFIVCRDEDARVAEVLRRAEEGKAFLEYEDDEGTRHELWKIGEPNDIDELESLFLDKKLIIADGHHRYETALAFSKENLHEPDLESPSDYVCSIIFRSEDPGLVILPVHRLLKRLPLSMMEVMERLGESFEIEEIQATSEGLADAVVEIGETEATAFVMLTADYALRLALKKRIDLTKVMPGPESKSWKNLDISILHYLLLSRCLGLDGERLAESGELYFTPWLDSALEDVRQGRAEACFLVRPTSIDEIWRIAEGGERMPHKSSYFYPKLPSGLVIYDHASPS